MEVLLPVVHIIGWINPSLKSGFHPSPPDKLYVLPIDHEEVFAAGSTLDEAIALVLNSGVLAGDEDEEEDLNRPNGLYFEPFLPENWSEPQLEL